jgi:tetratricopeptide (TPR) repeat protein
MLFICIALTAITWFVFGQTLSFGFTNYDDPEWVSENPYITRGITTQGAAWALMRVQAGPLASISHMLDCDIYGLNPAGHHFTNVLLHTLTVLLLFLVLRQMTGAMWRSGMVAALFAIHPLRVESVAWVTERKDVLSGLFFVITLSAYVWYVHRPSIGRYLAVAFFFVLGLLSKGMLMTLPLVLLLLDYWPLARCQTSDVRGQRLSSVAKPLKERRSPDRRTNPHGGSETAAPCNEMQNWIPLIVEKIPLFAFSAAAALATFLTHTRALASVEAVPFLWRVGNAFVSCITYIRQMFWPVGLAAFYPHAQNQMPIWQAAGSIVLLIGVTTAVILWRRQHPYLVTGWFWYLVMLAPVTGIVQVGLQGHADRYTYLPQIGLYLMAVWLIADLSRGWTYRRQVLSVTALVVIAAFAMVARGLAASWHDSESLWTRAIAMAPDNDFAHTSLADLLLRKGRLTEAIAHSEAALRINPDNADAHNNLALAISRRGRVSEAVTHWKRSLEIQPENLNARCNLAWVLATAPESSLRDGNRAVELVERVALASGHANTAVLRILAAAYAESGRFAEAISAVQQALQLATVQGDKALTDYLRFCLENYEANRPLRDPALGDSPGAQ